MRNVDDNSFAVEKSSLILRLSKDGDNHTILTTCNVVRLSFEDVKSITAAASSTKKAAQGKRGYMGENGIQFKSIFKVARVEISTRGYKVRPSRRERMKSKVGTE
jgi:hypothetical protein